MLSTAAAVYDQECLIGTSLWEEILPLLHNHWHEVAHYHDIPLRPATDRYEAMERSGMIRIYTARLADGQGFDGKGLLVGYLVCFVAPSLHYVPHLYAMQDVLFVHPSKRGSRIGVTLIRFAHARLKDEGVTAIYQHTKAKGSLNIGPMLVRLLGYELVDEVYAKRLDGALAPLTVTRDA